MMKIYDYFIPTRRQVPPVLKSIFIFRTLTPNVYILIIIYSISLNQEIELQYYDYPMLPIIEFIIISRTFVVNSVVLDAGIPVLEISDDGCF